MEKLRTIVAILHGLLFSANIMFGVLLAQSFPKAEGDVGVGVTFAALTCFGTLISAILTISYDAVADTAISATAQAAVLSGVIIAWVYWLNQMGSV